MDDEGPAGYLGGYIKGLGNDAFPPAVVFEEPFGTFEGTGMASAVSGVGHFFEEEYDEHDEDNPA